MHPGLISPRKYFVIVTRSATTQLELESFLSADGYKTYDSSQVTIYVEDLTLYNSAGALVDGFSQHLASLPPSLRNHRDTIEREAESGRTEHQPNPSWQTWKFGRDRRVLARENAKVVLTGTESALVKTLLQANQRVVSRDDLIRGIGREPDHYRGLEMCLSRLQEKFKSASRGERLFRAVRNRGYCLIQAIDREN